MPAILSFPLFGPSRRADVPIIEVRLDARAADFPSACPGRDELGRRLGEHGLKALLSELCPDDPALSLSRRFAERLGTLALQLQRHAGHPVEWLQVRQSRFADWRTLVLVECADAEVGLAAVQLATVLLGPQHTAFAGQLPRFLAFARERRLPADLAAVARTADQRGIPVLCPARPPLDRVIPPAGPGRRPALVVGQGVRLKRLEPPLDLGPVENDSAMEEAAGRLLDSLFTEPSAARIPVVAVTGTNGKTTTTRMVAHLLQAAGWRTGLVTSEGINIDGRQVFDSDSGSFVGHARVLTDPGIEAAALEAHHRGIVLHGFAFRDCDVGICLNVSPDHIAPGEIETMEEMEDVKAAIPERASGAAVLFADDPHCRAMAGRLRANSTWWVSLTQTPEALARLPASGHAVFCVLEERNGAEWVVFYRGGRAEPLMPARDIPATFSGAARFMVSNAMHAASAALALGIDHRRVVDALSGFYAGEAMTPGRLNEIDGLPFRLILDFAHNPDGMARLAEFTDRLEVPGRKFLALSGMGKREDIINRQSAEAVAGHFDHYFCKDYTPSDPPLKRPVAPLMQEALIEAGVAPEDTTLLTYGKSVLFEILSRCEPGDLLIYLIGNAEKAVIARYIEAFRQRLGDSPWLDAASRAADAWFDSLATRDAAYVDAVRQRLPRVRRRALARTLLALGREGLVPLPPDTAVFSCAVPGAACRVEVEGFSGSRILLRSDLRRMRARWEDGRIEVIEHPARLLEIVAIGQDEHASAWERLAMEIGDSVLNEALALAAHDRTNAGLALAPGGLGPAQIHRCLRTREPSADGALFLDQWAATGHPLHTVPKARMGLAPAKALDLCPEFHPRVPVRLAAVRRERACAELPAGYARPADWFGSHYPEWLGAWRSRLEDQGLDSEEFEPFPVHPWQADNVLAQALDNAGRPDEAVLLAGPELTMLPCLSVRSMVPADRHDGPGFKLALGVRLTSGVRTITPRSCHMGPRVSRLLRGMFEQDRGFGGQADLLDEPLGAHYRSAEAASDIEKHFSYLARDAVSRRVGPGQLAATAAALAEPFPDEGLPLLMALAGGADHPSPCGQDVFEAYAEAFLGVVLRTYLVYGIALEAHGQNVVAVFDRDGQLRKFLLRDLAGIRIHEPTLQRLDLPLAVHPDRRTVVQDFDDHRFWLRHRAYHCHLGHLAHSLSVATGDPEQRYWRLAGEVTARVFAKLRPEVEAKHWERERRALLDEPWTAKASLSMRLKNQVRDLPFTTANPLRARPGAA